MKKTLFSQEPKHVEARQKYGDSLRVVTYGANATQLIEGINSVSILFILFKSKMQEYNSFALYAAALAAILLAYILQYLIRVKFGNFARLKNDNTSDDFQRGEIRFALLTGSFAAIVALCLTFSATYLVAKGVNATTKHSIVAINAEYDSKIEAQNNFWIKAAESERKDYEKTVENIENKFNAKAKTAKTEADQSYILSQKQRAFEKQKAKFDSAIYDQEQQKAKDIQLLLDAKKAAVLSAESENGVNTETELHANNQSYWFFFLASVILVSLSVVFVYKKAEYMEKCGITIVHEQKKPQHHHAAVILFTLCRRSIINRSKNIMIDLNNSLGVDVKDIDGVAIPNSSKPKKTNMEKIVFTAPAVLEQEKTVEVVPSKVETVKTEPIESNVFEFDLKPNPIVQQQNSDKSESFKNYVYKNMGGVTVNSSVEKMLNSYRESEKGRLQIAARKQGVHTYLKRFYDYAATGKEPIKVRKQAETVLANGLWLIENGFSVECSDDTGKLQIIINEKKK
jgi:hypothetical protein